MTVDLENYSGDLLVTVGRYPEYNYGDRLKISGKLEEPFETEEFSYKDYLARYDIYATMRYPKIEKLGEGSGSPMVAAMLFVKHKFMQSLSQLLPEPQNAFALGLLLGLKRALPEGLKNALIVTGVSHIVVISGYNISIIVRTLLKSSAWWGRRLAFLLSLAVVLGFVIMTGAEASVVRAAIMGGVLILALSFHRLYQSVNALVFVGALMIAQNPKILAFDIGFQLSFLATLGLVLVADRIEPKLKLVPNILAFRTNLASTLAAQIFTLPLLIIYFDKLSLISPLVNILVLWAVPYAMFFIFAAGLAGLIFLPLAKFLVLPAWALLTFFIKTVELFSRLPYAAVPAHSGWLAAVIYYFTLSIFLLWKKSRQKFGLASRFS